MNIFEVFNQGSAKFVGMEIETPQNTKMVAELRKQFFGKAKITCVKSILANVNWSYSDVVNSRRVREGVQADFKASKSNYIHYGGRNTALMCLRSNPKTWYFRYYNPQTLSITYYIDGVEATADQVAQIKASFKPVDPNRKQGLSKDQQVVVRNVKFENIRNLRFGNTPDSKFVMADLVVPAEVQASVEAQAEKESV